MNLKNYFFTILILCFFINTSYTQKEVDFDEYYGMTDDGRICLKKGKYVFTVDTLGNLVGPKMRMNERDNYKKSFTFSNNLYIDYDTELIAYAFLDGSGKQLTPYDNRDFAYGDGVFTLIKKTQSYSKNNTQFKDLSLKNLFEIIDKEYSFSKKINLMPLFQHSFSEGLCIVEKNMKFGFLDRKGKIIIPIIFEEVKPFSEGLAAVLGRDSNNRPRWGFIDKTGKLVIPYKFMYEPGNFSSGISLVRNEDNGDTGGRDKNGNVIIPMEYGGLLGYAIKPFTNGVGLFLKLGRYGYEKCLLINSRNEIIRDFPFVRSSQTIPAEIFKSGYVLQESKSQTKKNLAQQEVIDFSGKTIFIADDVNYTIREVLPNRYMYYTSYDVEKGFRNSLGKIMFRNIKK